MNVLSPPERRSMIPSQDLQYQQLLDLARDRSAESRARLVEIVGDLFFGEQKVLTDRERSLMSDILQRLIHNVEVVVRRALADRLAGEPTAPEELVKTLANDVIEVAYPILRNSAALRDVDLVEIIQHRTLQHQLAIAMRKSLSEAVSDALVETRNEDVIKTLLENQDARISEGTLEYLVDESKRVDAYQNPLVNRNDLPEDVARRMYWWVSAALRTFIVERFPVDPVALDETMEAAVKHVFDSQKFRGETPISTSDLAAQLRNSQRITPKLLVQTLRQGEVALFEDLFGELVNLAPRLVRRFIFEQGGEALAIACRSVNVDKADFASIFILSRAARAGDRHVEPDELQRILEFYDSIDFDTADKVVRRWRLDPNFLYAVKIVEGGLPQAG